MEFKKFFYLFFSVLFTSGVQAQQNGTKLFDKDWRFHRGAAQGAEAFSFDDSGWRKLDLPHDWSIEDLPGTASPFNRDAISQVSGGFTTGGNGWYRKTFTVPATQKGKKTIIQFDGVYMNADVWINGKGAGTHPYGYTSFWYDITDKLKYGGENVVAVKVKNEGENSRWYSGSGIYRHVWLTVTEPLHLTHWGVSVTTPEVSAASARVNIAASIQQEGLMAADVTLVTRILNGKGAEVANTKTTQSIQPATTLEFSQTIVLKFPLLWSVETPYLYKAVTEVYTAGALTDRTETPFGIRTISIDVVNGFRLNGKGLKLKGGCVHHDNGPLGARAYDRAEERRVELLKASGYNAVRCAHNPPLPAFLDACDRLGMLVLDEAFDMWREGKNPFDYHLYFDTWWQRDIESMVLRDRNHPSVIMWSIGNEIPERGSAAGVKTAGMLAGYIKKFDTTRAITSAVNGLNPDKDPYFAVLNVGGYNYASGGDYTKGSLYAADHQRVPDRIMMGTESYPLEAFSAWTEVEDHPYVIGDFVWTAFDYVGEASIGWRGYYQYQNFYPWNLAYCGDIDICGWKRPQSYYRDALWKGDQLSLFVTPPQLSFEVNLAREVWSKWHWLDDVADWNWNGYENKPLSVKAYSSCEEVELFLNGKSLGKKPTNRATQYTATWPVPYAAGTLKAIGYTGEKKVNGSELHTASKPAAIKLTPDRTHIRGDGQDLSYITIDLTDEQGTTNLKAEDEVSFSVDGPGTIAGVGNAYPVSLESYSKPHRKAWRGKCLVIIKSAGGPGAITVTASAEGLKSARVSITAN